MYVCMCVCVYMCMYVCMYVYMYVCMYVCMYVYRGVCIYISICKTRFFLLAPPSHLIGHLLIGFEVIGHHLKVGAAPLRFSHKHPILHSKLTSRVVGGRDLCRAS